MNCKEIGKYLFKNSKHDGSRIKVFCFSCKKFSMAETKSFIYSEGLISSICPYCGSKTSPVSKEYVG